MRSLAARLFSLSLIATLIGCSEFQIESRYDSEADFASLRSFAWSTPTRVATGSTGTDREFQEDSVRGAVEKQLAKKGYRKTSAADADFLVTYRSVIKRKTESADLDGQRGYGAGLGYSDDFGNVSGGSGTIVEEFEEGTIVVTVLSSDGSHALWAGSAKAVILEDVSEAKRRERLERAVKRILANFPPS